MPVTNKQFNYSRFYEEPYKVNGLQPYHPCLITKHSYKIGKVLSHGQMRMVAACN